jgi:hypothetical protein
MYELHPDLIWSTALRNPAAFVAQLKNRASEAGVEQRIWNALHRQTRIWIEENHPIDSALMNLLVQDLNRILVQEHLEDAKGEPAKRVSPHGTVDDVLEEAESPAARLRRNRSVLADTFGDSLRRRQGGPLQVINTALNLTASENGEWQGPKTESFSISALHSGSFNLGYRESREYGGSDGISLGTALTISGAAASRREGDSSSPGKAFLLTLLNGRLGSWLGNPGTAGEFSYSMAEPKSNLHPMVLELVGMPNDQSSLVYLTDGGHFENLGIYEMVLRRCRYIVICDGSCDPKFTFEDLGNAIRRIRTDLGVEIEIGRIFMFARASDGGFPEGQYAATGSIRYSAIDENAKDGMLIYLKPAVYSENHLPKDVQSYALESADFPHESTADQFFSDSQFEGYRALGRHVINEVCGNYDEESENPRAPFARQFATIAEFAEAVAERAR